MPKVKRQRISRTSPTSKIVPASTGDSNSEIVKAATSKTLKKKQRHEAWLEKLDHTYAARKKQQKKASRQGALNKGFDDFEDVLQTIEKETLPTVDNGTETLADSTVTTSNGSHIISSDKIKSKKAKKKAMMQEIIRFQKVMQHNAFKQDPLSTIRQHVQNSFK